jgi:hypothetical protein
MEPASQNDDGAILDEIIQISLCHEDEKLLPTSNWNQVNRQFKNLVQTRPQLTSECDDVYTCISTEGGEKFKLKILANGKFPREATFLKLTAQVENTHNLHSVAIFEKEKILLIHKCDYDNIIGAREYLANYYLGFEGCLKFFNSIVSAVVHLYDHKIVHNNLHLDIVSVNVQTGVVYLEEMQQASFLIEQKVVGFRGTLVPPECAHADIGYQQEAATVWILSYMMRDIFQHIFKSPMNQVLSVACMCYPSPISKILIKNLSSNPTDRNSLKQFHVEVSDL